VNEVIEINVMRILARVVYSGMTLYMMLILLRWLAPWLQVDLYSRYLRWVPRITDPLIHTLRRALPSMGPVDFGPIAALFVVWVVRALSVMVLVQMAVRSARVL